MGETGPTALAVAEKVHPEAKVRWSADAHARWPSGRMVGVAGAAGDGGSWEEGESNSVRIGAPCPDSTVATQAAGDVT